MIKTDNLQKWVPMAGTELEILKGITLEIKSGESIAIIGASGSGKSTLLGLMAGLDEASAGSVSIDGTILGELDEDGRAEFRARHIGFVFQSYNLIPVLTAKENVEFIMSLQKWNKKEKDQRTFELLKAVGLEDRVNSRPSKLSGGQQQRVAVARALASKPKFVLADEPTANLDSKSTETLLDIMEQLNREEGITFIFSTHDARVVKKARRVITVEDGKVISDEKKN